jgi:hypothetical protein
MTRLLSQRKLDEIRGKMLVGKATPEEVEAFLHYVSKIEGMVEDASNEDFFGSEGWTHTLWGD